MKKLLNKRGTVLFLVVVVMALLLVAASATYYVIRNQHASAVTHYGSEQSYQTALSVSETVLSYIDGQIHKIQDGTLSYNSNNIVKQMVELKENDIPLSATPTNLAEEGLGEFYVEISKYKQDGNTHYFNIKTTAEVNGETVSLTQSKKITITPVDQQPATYYTRFLTSTGNRPEDVILSAAQIHGDAYFENEYTYLGNPTVMNRSFYVTRTLVDGGLQFNNTDDMEVVIGENFYINSAEGQANMEMKGLLVGGNLEQNAKYIKAKATYVMGDMIVNSSNESTFFIQGDCYVNTNTSTDSVFYINGDLHIGKDGYWYGIGTFYVNGDVYVYSDAGYCAEKAIHCKNNIYNLTSLPDVGENPWDYTFNSLKEKYFDSETDFNIATALQKTSEKLGYTFSSFGDVENYISNETVKGDYQSWNAERYFNEVLYPSNNAPVVTPGESNIDGVVKSGQDSGGYYSIISKSCKLKPWSEGDPYWGGAQAYMIIDASKEDIYIYLDHNGMTDSNGKPYFSFIPDGYSQNSILVRGSHAVIFILPSGVSYKASFLSFIGHEELALQLAKDMGAATTMDGLLATKNIFATVGNSNSKASYFTNLMTEDSEGDLIIDKSKFPSGSTVHNNIFLVSALKDGDENYIDFNTQTTFCGYIYAPDSRLYSDGGYDSIPFFGGIIVGSYTYTNISAALVFVRPNEENHPDGSAGRGKDIVSSLISICPGAGTKNNGNPIGGSGSSTVSENVNLGYR